MSLSLEPEKAFTGPLAAAVAARCPSLHGGVLTLTPPQRWTAVMGAKLQRASFTAASSLLEKTGRLMVAGPGRHVLPIGSSLRSTGLCLWELIIGPWVCCQGAMSVV